MSELTQSLPQGRHIPIKTPMVVASPAPTIALIRDMLRHRPEYHQFISGYWVEVAGVFTRARALWQSEVMFEHFLP